MPWMLYRDHHNVSFPDRSVIKALNYCRNINKHVYGPWCFVELDDGKRRGFTCDIPYCSDVTIDKRECKITDSGFAYAGTVSKTNRGDECMSWTEQKDYSHYSFPENNVTEAKNYCRNVDNSKEGAQMIC